jgi:hypothetical protein
MKIPQYQSRNINDIRAVVLALSKYAILKNYTESEESDSDHLLTAGELYCLNLQRSAKSPLFLEGVICKDDQNEGMIKLWTRSKRFKYSFWIQDGEVKIHAS